MENILYIFENNGKIKALTSDEVEELAIKLLKKGWHHASTIEPSALLEYLYNESKDLEFDFKDLLIKL